MNIIFSALGAVYKGRPANGERGGFETSDIPGRGEGGGGGGLWKFGRPKISEKIEIPKFLRALYLLKLEIIIDRDSNMRAFTYDVCSNLGVSK